MRKLTNWLRRFFAGLIALVGAGLVGWQGVLIYYQISGRVAAGDEEHLPLTVAVAILAFGLFLFAGGYVISKTDASRPKRGATRRGDK